MPSSISRALITGITGQDGPFLANHLLTQDCEVWGLVRGQYAPKWETVQEYCPGLRLLRGDLLDQGSIISAIQACNPDVIFNLGALSFVGTSWNQPAVTSEVTGLGALRVLEAIRLTSPRIRFVQASSSEMFGGATGAFEEPQRETTPFAPRSPYAVAKVYAHHMTVNYRESYGMHASAAIMHNHECLVSSTPLIVRQHGVLAVRTPPDIVPLSRKGRIVQSFEPQGLEVWANDDWTKVCAITATKRRQDRDHALLSVEGRAGVIQVTAHHTMLGADGRSLKARDLKAGDEILLCNKLPAAPGWTVVTAEMAELLGMLTADGYVGQDGQGLRFTNNNSKLRCQAATLWSKTFLGSHREWFGPSGFNKGATVWHVQLNGGGRSVLIWLREQLYTRTAHKQVPPIILNSDTATQQHFLRGYYSGDGLKKGNGLSATTNSPVLAQGLIYLYHNAGHPTSVYVEVRKRNGRTRSYYHLNFGSATHANKGAHRRLPPQEVRQIRQAVVDDDEWVFDLETESGVLNAGIGRLLVHNSPRRGPEFVTRRITRAVAAISRGEQDRLVLGRLDPRRDWGYAPEYMAGMALIAAQDTPGDYVLATGRTASVQDFAELAFGVVGLDWRDYVVEDPARYRPAEVLYLCGDASKAGEVLGWVPQTGLEDLVKTMVNYDLTATEGHG